MTTSAVVMRVHSPGGPLVADRVTVEPPGRGWVRVAVVASGICGADIGTAAARGAARLPVTPGHEVAGTVAELGDGVEGWAVGDRVAVGWFGGSCGHCEFCRRGDVVHCRDRMTPGVSYRGGWAESVVVPAQALARIPDGLESFDAAPMGCAGVTTFNAVRQSGVPAGGTIAVFGLGGLGHLAVQFAAKLGYDVVAIARGRERASVAATLGARRYIDSAAAPVGATLRAAGGVDAVISTAPDTASLTELLDGMRVHGRLIVIGIGGGRLEVPVGQLVMKAQTVRGHLTGSPQDTEEAMRFAVLNDVRPVIERIPLEAAQDGLERLRAGRARFRVVLDATDHRDA